MILYIHGEAHLARVTSSARWPRRPRRASWAKRVLGSDFSTRSRYGAARVVRAGEETALMESLEGRRAMLAEAAVPDRVGRPRSPTVINNVETSSRSLDPETAARRGGPGSRRPRHQGLRPLRAPGTPRRDRGGARPDPTRSARSVWRRRAGRPNRDHGPPVGPPASSCPAALRRALVPGGNPNPAPAGSRRARGVPVAEAVRVLLDFTRGSPAASARRAVRAPRGSATCSTAARRWTATRWPSWRTWCACSLCGLGQAAPLSILRAQRVPSEL